MAQGFLHLLHLFPEAQRPHVSPNLFDIGEALVLFPVFACITPAKSILALGRPNRILLFMVDDDLVDRRVFSFVSTHFRLKILL